MGLDIVYVGSQKELHYWIQRRGSIRVGSTQSPRERAAAYYSQGYRGTFYYARAGNMMAAEDNLLEYADYWGAGRHNVHRASNAQAASGFVYVIVGRRM